MKKAESYIGKQFGMLDVEFSNCDEAIFCGKKFYYIGNADGKDKMRCKGLPSNHLSKEVFENVLYRGSHTANKITQFQRVLFSENYTGIMISENVDKTLKADQKLSYKQYIHSDERTFILEHTNDKIQNENLVTQKMEQMVSDELMNFFTDVIISEIV
jgi:predicted RNA binding protein YcfA (HicA-like mRNA interferase family)